MARVGQLHPEPTTWQRFGQAAYAVPSGVYAHGGVGGKEHRRIAQLVNHAPEFGQAMAQPTPMVCEVEPSARLHHTITATGYDDMAIMVGGRGSPLKPCNDLWRFDPTLKASFQQLDSSPLLSRWRHDACMLGKDVILVTGGQTVEANSRQPQLHSQTAVLISTADEWETVTITGVGCGLPPRHSHTLTALNDTTALVCGGLDAQGHMLSDLQLISLPEPDGASTLCVEEIQPSAPLPTRFGHKAVLVSQHADTARVLVVGGCDEAILPWDRQCILMDIDMGAKTAQWCYLVLQAPKPIQDTTMLINHSVMVVGDQVLIAYGGGNCFSFGTHFNHHTIAVAGLAQVAMHARMPIQRLVQANDPTITALSLAFLSTERQPFVLTGCRFTQHAWDAEFLSATCADKEASVHVAESDNMDFLSRNFKFEVMSFPDLVKKAFDPASSELLYLRSMGVNFRKDVANLQATFPELAADFALPDGVPQIPEYKLFSTALRISSAGVQLWTHYDVMDNYLCNITGRKRVLLWPPSQAGNLYLDGSSSAVVDVEQPDLVKFPKFAVAMQHAIELVLEPGDMLHIPALWCHNVRALTPCVSVNVFWKHLDPELYVKKDLYGNKDVQPAAEATKLLQQATALLDTLPADHKAFYLAKGLSAGEAVESQ
eukprot:TRINITY_DN9029_c0_g1_i3.p1 TRINITY_DN9029_c0_g1~~TRINITY_DN9029_c0_g1_i3.p1  ORF type:complete len:683 (+),score=127.18 TRINITY_DN9029_c0_g1_i3:81-2051(+)